MSEIKKGSIINLSDEQTLEDKMAEGSIVKFVPYTVSRIREFAHDCGITWEVMEVSEDEDLFLVRKSVDDLSDWFVYFRPDGVRFGSRIDFIDDGLDYLFEDDDVAPSIVTGKQTNH